MKSIGKGIKGQALRLSKFEASEFTPSIIIMNNIAMWKASKAQREGAAKEKEKEKAGRLHFNSVIPEQFTLARRGA